MESIGKDAPKLKGCLKASKVRNIEGKMMGKDCKLLLPVGNIKSGVEKVESVGLIKNPTFGLEDEGVDMNDTNESMHSPILESQPSKFKQAMNKELKHPHGWENPNVSAMKSTTPNNPQKQSFANVGNDKSFVKHHATMRRLDKIPDGDRGGSGDDFVMRFGGA
nr:hypothetical protein [Tanacetum cinerariifolium]